METISSKSTFFSKKVFPFIFVCFLLLFIAGASRDFQRIDFVFLFFPVLILVVGGFAFKRLVWPLLDEVRDAGDSLILRRGSDEERIALAEIMNVSVSYFSNPPRITLRLTRSSAKFGSEVAFLPRTGFRLTPFSRIRLADELIERVHRARSSRAV